MKRIIKAVIFIFVIVLLINITLDTSSKYIGKTNKINETSVAKWDVKLNGKKWSEELEFDLFSSLKSETDEKLVAPGAKGTFEFTINNDSDIASLYTMNINVTNENNIPIEYKINDSEWIIPDQAGNINLATNERLDVAEEKVIKVDWQWSYDGTISTNYNSSQTTSTDNELGNDGTASINVKVSIDAEQVRLN